jgi:hypothetical protein
VSFASESVRVDVIVPTSFISVSLFLLFFNNFVFFFSFFHQHFLLFSFMLTAFVCLDTGFGSLFRKPIRKFSDRKKNLIFIRTAVSLFPVLYPSPSIVNLKGKTNN